MHTSPGILTEHMRLYVATQLRQSSLEMDLDECIEIQSFSFSHALRMIQSGRVSDGKTILGLLLLMHRHPDLTVQ